MTAPTIVQALAAVMGSVAAVPKDGRGPHGEALRGIDAVVNAVGPALRAHGVVVVPEVLALEMVAGPGGKGGTVRVQVAYAFVGPAGDHLRAVVPAEAFDTGDRATTKAMSVAYRTALVQVLCIPTDPTQATRALADAGAERRASELLDQARQATTTGTAIPGRRTTRRAPMTRAPPTAHPPSTPPNPRSTSTVTQPTPPALTGGHSRPLGAPPPRPRPPVPPVEVPPAAGAVRAALAALLAAYALVLAGYVLAVTGLWVDLRLAGAGAATALLGVAARALASDLIPPAAAHPIHRS